MVQLVGLSARHRVDVERIMWSTYLLGQPLPFEVCGANRLAGLALDWFFECGLNDSVAVVDAGSNTMGYGLVCCYPEEYQRWLRRELARTSVCLFGRLALGRIDQQSRDFLRLRLRDARTIAGSQRQVPRSGHAHVNLLPGLRSGSVAVKIRDHIDDRCRAAGLTHWAGEVNAREGKRASSLERVGGTIVSTRTNLTFTALVGAPIVRLTLLRTVS